MSWRDNSEIVVGHALRGVIDPESVSPAKVSPPYDRIIRALRRGKTMTDIAGTDLDMVSTCMAASERANGVADIDYIRLLTQSALFHESGDRLSRLTTKLQRGEEIDPADLLSIAARLETETGVWQTLADVTPTKVAFQPSYWPPLDKFLGGIPVAALTVIAGPPGAGKTTLVAKLAARAAAQRKKVVLFEFEMRAGELLMRLIQSEKPGKKALENVICVDTPMDVHDVYSTAVQIIAQEKPYCIFVDSAMMLVDEEDYVAISKMYRQLDILARKSNTPVVLISQLNSAYTNDVPKINHIRGSRLAEYHARLILMIWNPSTIWAQSGTDSRLPLIPGAAWVIVGKSTYGFGKQASVGAFAAQWKENGAWGDKDYGWRGLSGGI